MTLELKKFDMRWITFKPNENKGPVIVMIGRRDTGKSFLVRDLLYHHQDVPIGTVISGTEAGNGFYAKHVPKLFIHEEYNTVLIENVLRRQKAVLKQMNKDTWNFDIHTPIKYSRDKFIEAMESVDWRKPNGYVIKSLYCNYFDIEGMPHIDLKISTQVPFHRLRKTVEGQDIFSIGDRAIGLPMKKLLDLYFSEKSKFEL